MFLEQGHIEWDFQHNGQKFLDQWITELFLLQMCMFPACTGRTKTDTFFEETAFPLIDSDIQVPENEMLLYVVACHRFYDTDENATPYRKKVEYAVQMRIWDEYGDKHQKTPIENMDKATFVCISAFPVKMVDEDVDCKCQWCNDASNDGSLDGSSDMPLQDMSSTSTMSTWASWIRSLV